MAVTTYVAFGDVYPDEESYHDERVEDAKQEVLRVIEEQRVVTDREFKVRLERKFFPWVVGKALDIKSLENVMFLKDVPNRVFQF